MELELACNIKFKTLICSVCGINYALEARWAESQSEGQAPGWVSQKPPT